MKGELIPASARIMYLMRTPNVSFNNVFARFPCFGPGFHVSWSNRSCFRGRFTSKLTVPEEKNYLVDLEKLLKSGHLRMRNIEDEMKKSTAYTDHDRSTLLFRCISKLPDVSPETRVYLAENFFNKIKSVSGSVTEAHCLGVLESYLQSRYFENLQSFLSELKSNSVDSTNNIQLLVLKCLSEKGMKEEVSSLAQDLEKEGIEDIEELYSSIIYSYAISGDINKALQEYKKMKEKEINIGSTVYTSLFRAIALKGDLSEMENLSKVVLQEGITFSDDQIISILENLVIKGHYPLLPIVRLLCVDNVLFKVSQVLLVKLIHSNYIESAYNFLDHMLTLSYICEPDDEKFFFNAISKSMIEESCKVNYPLVDLIKHCLRLRESGKCNYTLEGLLYPYLQRNDIANSLLILKLMSDNGIVIEPHYLWPLFITASQQFGDEGIIYIMQKAVELHVVLDPETFLQYIFPNLSDLWFVQKIQKRVHLLPFQHELMIEVFIMYCLKHGLYEVCLKFLRLNPPKKIYDYNIFGKYWIENVRQFPVSEETMLILKELNIDPTLIISKLSYLGDEEKLFVALKYLKKLGIYMKDRKEVEAILRRSENHGTIRKYILDLWNSRKDEPRKNLKLCRVEEVRLMEDSEVHLAELKAKNLNAVNQKMRLFKLYFNLQLFDKAIKIQKEILHSLGDGAEFTAAYLLFFCRLAAYEDNLEKGLYYFNTLKEKYPNFQIGVTRAIPLCLLFLERNLYDEMLTILRIMPKWEEDIDALESKMVQILRKVAEMGMPQSVDIVFKIMLRKKYLKENSNTLQAYTQAYLHAKDLDGAVKEFERIVEEYNVCSNVVPVLKKIIEADRIDLLERLMKVRLIHNKHIKILILTVIASKGDPDFLLSFSQRLDLPLDDNLLITKFLSGLVPIESLTTHKTLITAALKMEIAYQHFVESAIETIMITRDYKGALEFLDFCRRSNISVTKDNERKLLNFGKLGEVAATATSTKYQ